MPKQGREVEASGPRGQRAPRASRRGPSRTEFVRPAHQAVVAIVSAGIINRAEPRACGASRGSRCPGGEPATQRTASAALNRTGNGPGRAPPEWAGASNRIGESSLYGRMRGGWRKREQDLEAVCHDARKSRYRGSRWSELGAPPLHSTTWQPLAVSGLNSVFFDFVFRPRS
jgi:hypothetical protein